MQPENRLDEAIKQTKIATNSDRVGPVEHDKLTTAIRNIRMAKRQMELIRDAD